MENHDGTEEYQKKMNQLCQEFEDNGVEFTIAWNFIDDEGQGQTFVRWGKRAENRGEPAISALGALIQGVHAIFDHIGYKLDKKQKESLLSKLLSLRGKRK